jgi:hypothetical protein
VPGITSYRAIGRSALKRERLDEVLLFTALKQFWLLGFHSIMGDCHGTVWLNDGYYDAAFKWLREATKALNLTAGKKHTMPDHQSV